MEHHATSQAPAGRVELHVPEADGLRGMASLTIVFYHCWVLGGYALLDNGPLRAILGSGYFAVDLFFVISGFVLFLPTAVRGSFGSVRAYAIRRGARILPAYYLSLAIVILFHAQISRAVVALPGQSWAGWGSLLVHLTFLQQEFYGLGDQTGFGNNTVVWTLSGEMAFYVLLPLIAMRVYRRPWLWLTGMYAASFAWKLFATHTTRWLPLLGIHPLAGKSRYLLEYQLVGQMPSYLGHFATGMTIALLYPRLIAWARSPAVARAAVAAQVACLALLLWLLYVAGAKGLIGADGPYDHHLNWGVMLACGGLLAATIMAPAWGRWLFTNAAARHLGDASYGVYLYHVPLIGFLVVGLGLHPTGGNRLFLELTAITVPVSVLAGILSWRLMEDPMRRWARTVMRSPASASRPAVAAVATEVVRR